MGNNQMRLAATCATCIHSGFIQRKHNRTSLAAQNTGSGKTGACSVNLDAEGSPEPPHPDYDLLGPNVPKFELPGGYHQKWYTAPIVLSCMSGVIPTKEEFIEATKAVYEKRRIEARDWRQRQYDRAGEQWDRARSALTMIPYQYGNDWSRKITREEYIEKRKQELEEYIRDNAEPPIEERPDIAENASKYYDQFTVWWTWYKENFPKLRQTHRVLCCDAYEFVGGKMENVARGIAAKNGAGKYVIEEANGKGTVVGQ